MTNQNPITASLLRDVERYLKKHRMRPTTFGKEAVGDFGFVSALRRFDRDLKASTIHRVQEYMRANNGKERA